jgi:selenocysteine-specific elongation factor
MRSVVIGTAGHIDHGKSALVTALTGTDPDRLKEEKARGITIDLGFAHRDADGVTLAFVDVPGHERFVRTMLAGAGGIDAVLLVVAADESVKPQTREHFEICRLLGLDRGIIALTKADLADPDTIGLVTLEVRELVANSFLADAPVIPVSARTGQGLDTLTHALAALAGGPVRLGRDGVARLPVDRAFTVKGFGTVVTGTLVSGRVAEGDELVALPEGRSVRVRGVQVHGRQARDAQAPGRVALNLGSGAIDHLSRGVTLASPDSLAVTRRADLDIELLAGVRPLRHGARVRLHHGTSEVLGRVSIGATRPPGAAEWRRAEPGEPGIAVPAAGRGFVRIRLERPAVLTRDDRVVLRAYSPPVTIGGGRVLDPEPAATGIRRAGTLTRFLTLSDPHRGVRVFLNDAGARGADAAAFVRRGGLGPAQAQALMRTEIAEGRARFAGGRAFDERVAAGMEQGILASLSEFHRSQPLEAGMPREALREQVAGAAAPDLFDAIAGSLAARGVIRSGERVARSDFKPTLSPEDTRQRDLVLETVRAGGLTPPDTAGLAAAAGIAAAEVQTLVQRLVREKKLVRLDTLVVHPDALDGLKEDIRSLGGPAAAGRVTVDVSTFKERYGLTRKYAIPLLEWLDRERVTRREGDRRVVIGN